MSLWGLPLIAPDAYLISFIYKFIFIMQECLGIILNGNKILLIINQVNNHNSIDIFYLFSLIKVNSNISNHVSSQKNKIVKLSSKKRIGPHNKIILSILFGGLLGDCSAEYRKNGNGTRFSFYQESSHVTYLIWLHGLLSNLGYCNPNKPEIKTRLCQKGTVRKVIRFKTWTYSSLNWIYDIWYVNNIKIVPSVIGEYLSPLALAIWIMDDGSKVGSGLKLSTNSFTYSDCALLIKVLYDNFNLKSTIQSAGKENQYHIYIWKESMPLLREIVLPYVHPSMKYKLGI